MTRRDYVAIAAALASTRPDPVVTTWEGQTNTFTNRITRDLWDATRDAIADALEAANPDGFDRMRFITAATRPPTLGPDGRFTPGFIEYMGGPVVAVVSDES